MENMDDAISKMLAALDRIETALAPWNAEAPAPTQHNNNVEVPGAAADLAQTCTNLDASYLAMALHWERLNNHLAWEREKALRDKIQQLEGELRSRPKGSNQQKK